MNSTYSVASSLIIPDQATDLSKLNLYFINILRLSLGVVSGYHICIDSQKSYKPTIEQACQNHKVGPYAVLSFRVLATLWTYYIIASVASFLRNNSEIYLSYTMWNFVLLSIYLTVGTILSIINILGVQYDLNKNTIVWVLVHFHTGTYHVLQTTVQVIFFIFWFVLVPMIKHLDSQGKFPKEMIGFILGFTSFNLHAVNNIFMMVELFITDIPYQQSKIGYAELWTLGYWTAACDLFTIKTNKFIYPFMDFTTRWAPLNYFGVYLSIHLFYWVTTQIVKIKSKFISPQEFEDSNILGGIFNQNDLVQKTNSGHKNGKSDQNPTIKQNGQIHQNDVNCQNGLANQVESCPKKVQ